MESLDTHAPGVFYGPSFLLSRCVVLLSLTLSLWAEPAAAAGFQIKTMRAPLSAVEVERPLVIGRGWLEFGLGVDYKLGTGEWTDDGLMDPFDGARWTYTTERMDIRYGISRRGELYWSLPFHYVSLDNDLLGTHTSDFGLGDPRFGWRLEWLRAAAPTRSVITELDFKLPAGPESPGSYIGGPNTVSAFVLSTGTINVGLSVRGKQQVGPFAVTAGIGYVYRASGLTQYCVETDQQQFLCRFKPGDEIRGSVEPMLQIGPMALSGEAIWKMRQVAKIGTTSPGFFPDAHLCGIEGSDGVSLDLAPALTLNATRGIDVRASVNFPMLGEDLMFFPLEDVNPTYGITYSGSVEIRY